MLDDNTAWLFTDCQYDVSSIKEHIATSGCLDLVRADDNVLIKPNFVQEKHDDCDDWDYMITYPDVITAVLELLCEKLSSNASITIADAPMTPTNWDALISHLPLDYWKKLCEDACIPFQLIDLRDEEWHNAPNGIILEKKQLPGDPNGKLLLNLKDDASEFFGKVNSKEGLYGACYDIKETNDAHNGNDNLYSISKSVVSSDIVINMPKLKTHKKGGITCCLKNLVGINTNKNLLPHHTTGTPAQGGDQFADSNGSKVVESGATIYAKRITNKFKFLTPLLVPLKNIALKAWGNNRETIRSGAWYGNDTLWRTIIDLNKVFFYGNEDGTLRSPDTGATHRYIAIVDGIFAGEGNGPLAPDKVEAGYLLCGTNPVVLDTVATRLMGFDYRKIPSVCKAFDVKKYKLANFGYSDISVRINGLDGIGVDEIDADIVKHFKPALGWKGHVELDDQQ